jgi:autotransporter-associated beta strand protein
LDAASVFDLEGSLASFTGTLLLTGPGSFRLNGSSGSASASFDLGTRSLSARNGGTYQIGSLTGKSGSSLSIATFTGAVTYSIGGNGGSTVFSGNIVNGAGTTHITKTGAGTLTLAGTCGHTGNTHVSGGTLRVTGSLGNTAVTVNANAVLEAAGSLSPASLNLAAASSLAMEAGPAGQPVRATGNVTLAGNLRITPAPGLAFGRFPLITHGGIRSGTFVRSEVTTGVPHHLSYSAGEVVLFLDDSDEDQLPDTWEKSHFGGLSQTAAGDYDGDGTRNLVEFRLGLDPASAGSAFAATVSGNTLTWPSAPGIVFTVNRSNSLDAASWQVIGTVTGGPGPTATFTDPDSLDRAFYRIGFEP